MWVTEIHHNHSFAASSVVRLGPEASSARSGVCLSPLKHLGHGFAKCF